MTNVTDVPSMEKSKDLEQSAWEKEYYKLKEYLDVLRKRLALQMHYLMRNSSKSAKKDLMQNWHKSGIEVVHAIIVDQWLDKWLEMQQEDPNLTIEKFRDKICTSTCEQLISELEQAIANQKEIGGYFDDDTAGAW